MLTCDFRGHNVGEMAVEFESSLTDDMNLGRVTDAPEGCAAVQ